PGGGAGPPPRPRRPGGSDRLRQDRRPAGIRAGPAAAGAVRARPLTDEQVHGPAPGPPTARRHDLPPGTRPGRRRRPRGLAGPPQVRALREPDLPLRARELPLPRWHGGAVAGERPGPLLPLRGPAPRPALPPRGGQRG